MKKFENILVAFDLNKTLFFKSEAPLVRKHDKKIKRLHFYFRPHLKQLIEYLHCNHINYCFWSNMLGRNCVKYIKQLETLGMSKYCGIFDQSFCDKAQNQPQIGQKIKTIKNLNKLAATFQIDVDCCILVDDSKQKNVQGCNLVQVSPYEGQQDDKQILSLIEKLKQFRHKVLSPQQKNLPMLKYTEYKFEQQPNGPSISNVTQQKIQKPHIPTELQIEIESNPQIRKLKSDLVLQKQIRKNIISQIQTLQKANAQMGEDIKKQSQGKVVRKGDQLLVQLLLFAKNKKTSQKKIEQLQKNKKNSDEKIQIIKKLMRSIVEKINLHLDPNKSNETDNETRGETGQQLPTQKNQSKTQANSPCLEQSTQKSEYESKGARQGQLANNLQK